MDSLRRITTWCDYGLSPLILIVESILPEAVEWRYGGNAGSSSDCATEEIETPIRREYTTVIERWRVIAWAIAGL